MIFRAVFVAAALLGAGLAASGGAQEIAPSRDAAPPGRVLEATGAPAVAAEAAVKDGELLSVPVRHGMTGRLINEIADKTWLGTTVLPAGTPVFGVPLTNPRGVTTIIWCAPKRGGAKNSWRNDCFSSAGTVYLSYAPALFTIRAKPEGRAFRGGVRIQPGPVDFGEPMRMVWRHREWTGRRVEVRQVLEYDDVSIPLNTLRLPIGPDRTADLRTLGGRLRLRLGTLGRVTVETVEPPTGALGFERMLGTGTVEPPVG